MLAGIEMCAMFHGVDQNLPESRYDLVFLSLGNARVSDAVQELNQAICSSKITSGRQGEPRGRPGKDFDAVVPTGLCHGRTHHFGERLKYSLAGTFGYQAETEATSRAMAEAALLPAVRAAARHDYIVADGTSCRHQILDLSGREAIHSVRLMERALPG